MVTLQPRERKALERVRSLERKWPMFRWFVLAYGLLALRSAWYVNHLAFSLAPQVEKTGDYRVTFFFVYGALGAGFAIVTYIGLATLSWLFRRWRGDPICTLLLRFLERSPRSDDHAS